MKRSLDESISEYQLAAKGMTLNFIAPMLQNGEKVVKLCKEEVELETQKWKHALILYVVGVTPTIASLERYITAQWNYITKPTVYYHNDGYFLVRFASLDDRDEVLYSRPHMLNNRPIIAKTWSPDFDLSKEVLQTIPIWVKFPNLPLNCWGIQSLSRISSGLGLPLYADECTTKVARISFARVLIELDITKELPLLVRVEDPNGKVFDQKVIYEWIPAYCPKCLQVGHKCTTNVQTKPIVQKDKPQVPQEWQPKRDDQAKLPNPVDPTGLQLNECQTPPVEMHIPAVNLRQRQGELTKEKEDDKWREVRGKSAARCVQRPLLVPGVNSVNDFNVLDDQGRGQCSYSGVVITATPQSLPT
uniref:Endonuclease/exonuclease/phosphatase n=1 Tax=Solanum tuberosum TaxID=4113 RepID=M1DNN1_SOLTU